MDHLIESIASLFSVSMVCVASDSAKELCKRKLGSSFSKIVNNLQDLKNLNVNIRDPCSNQILLIHRLRIKITSLEDIHIKPNGPAIKKLLYDCVSAYTQSLNLDDCISYDTPWYDAWRKTLIQTFENCDHEYIGGHFGSFFILTVKDLENHKEIINTLTTLVKSMNSIKWFSPNWLKYFLVLNEQDGNQVDDNDTSGLVTPLVNNEHYNDIKTLYGSNQCFWMTIPNNCVINENKIQETTPNNVNHSNNHFTTDPLTNSRNSSQLIENNVPTKIGDKLIQQLDYWLREFIASALIPWSERQLRVLNEAISLRKGLRKSIFSATQRLFLNSTNIRPVNQNIIYSLEANEMQQRKFADIAMCLTLYELAYSFYYSAKKEFQVEGAWIYYAGACEGTAIASILVNKPQKHYFEQAISCYLETCKSYNLATRATILATEVIKTISPNEASNLFIRMTSEESDLNSALFLEQAAKCFTLPIAGSKMRKAAFHYVLAGHRFNRCGLKRHALQCYLRYSSPYWSFAIEHVNYTVARLYIQIASGLTSAGKEIRERGLEILRNNSDKDAFFEEFVKEIKKDEETDKKQLKYLLDVPFIKCVSREPIEGSFVRNGRQTCFLNEKVILHLTLWCPFSLVLNNFSLYCNKIHSTCDTSSVCLESNEDQTVSSSFIATSEGEIDILGIEYETSNNILVKREFPEKLRKTLYFTCIRTLPALDVAIKIGDHIEGSDVLELYTGEIVDISVTIRLKDASCKWNPSNVIMSTNANILNEESKINIDLEFNEVNWHKFQAPQISKSYPIFFKFEYFDGQKSRFITKNIELYVRECFQLEGFFENVISLRNVLSNATISIFPSEGEQFDLESGITAHILLENPEIRWKIANREGLMSLEGMLGPSKHIFNYK